MFLKGELHIHHRMVAQLLKLTGICQGILVWEEAVGDAEDLKLCDNNHLSFLHIISNVWTIVCSKVKLSRFCRDTITYYS